MTTSIQSILMWINFDTFAANAWCPLFASYRMFSYVTGRILLYSYFIYRTNDIFKGTYLEFTNRSKYSLIFWCFIVVFTLVIPASYVYSTQHWSVQTDTTGNGTFCVSDDYNASYIQYLFMWGTLNDLFFAVTTIM